ncbi:MAG: phage terminase large subunit [Phycisphaerales bacterium]|nr:phage terminase large subunit [Phycisphaerales bacterium]
MNRTSQLQLTHLAGKLRALEREAGEFSLSAFAGLYFPHHVRIAPSGMHKAIYRMLEGLPTEQGGRMAVAAPRGSAKSTLVSLLFVLWCICYCRKKFIVMLSDTAEKASGFLDHVKQELVANQRLIEAFPEVCETTGQVPRPPRWRLDEIITHNQVKVMALGLGQNIRGLRHGADRPDLILLDDVESADNTATAESRTKVDNWFNRAILKAGATDTDVVVVGTIQHYDSLLARLTDPAKSPTWQSRIYRSVIRWSPAQELWERWISILRRREQYEGADGPEAARRYFDDHAELMLADTEVLWAEREDYYALMLMRETEGPAAFDAEKQNEPVNPADCYFLDEDFTFWEDQWSSEAGLIAHLGFNAQYIGACDPSLGKEGRHADDSAIITLIRDSKNGTLYVIDADIARRKPDRLLETILEYQRLRKYARFGFETNQFQSFLADELQRRSCEASLYLPVEPIVHTTDKIGRIQSLQPLVRSGTLKFSRRHSQLLEQLRLFPKAKHDDGPDALEMAVATARIARPPVIVVPKFEPPMYYSESVTRGDW